MAGHRLEIGEHGTIKVKANGDRFTASMYYRNNRGERRRLEATADSKTAARRELMAAFDRAMSTGGVGYTARSTFADVADQWYDRFTDLVAAGRRSPGSAGSYRSVLDLHVLPAIGGLRLTELTTARVDHFLQTVRRERGYATAKLCRSIVSGVCGFAVRRDAMRSNPVRDAGRLERDEASQARALTIAESGQWLAILDADPFAVRRDLPDLARFLLGTGVRVGEALGVLWGDVDLDRLVVHVRRTIIRVKGQGLIAKAPKSRSGVRSLRLPLWLAGVLRDRLSPNTDPSAPVFPDGRGGFRDVNNVEAAFRTVRAGTPFEWVVPHTYRKTVATLLDGDGLSARVIADQLGHSRISMTQDVYLGRRIVDGSAASSLESLFDDADDDDDDPPGVPAIAR